MTQPNRRVSSAAATRRAGVTLLELLIVLAIMVALSIVVVPALRSLPSPPMLNGQIESACRRAAARGYPITEFINARAAEGVFTCYPSGERFTSRQPNTPR